MNYDTHPVCSSCGKRIGLYGRLWLELESGTVRSSYTMDLEDLRHQARRLWHPGCVPAKHLHCSH